MYKRVNAYKYIKFGKIQITRYVLVREYLAFYQEALKNGTII